MSKEKRSTKKNPASYKECFGQQGSEMLAGEFPIDCMSCSVYEKCHKMTVSVSIQLLSDNLELIIQNGLLDGRLKTFNQLNPESPETQATCSCSDICK